MNTPDRARLEALMIEAGTFGDFDLVETCEAALGGDPEALRFAAEVIAEASQEGEA